MSYCDNPEQFDLNLFMQAMGYDQGYLGKDFMEECGIKEDICLWSDHELTFVSRDGDDMTIQMSVFADEVEPLRDLETGRATLLREVFPDEPGRRLVEVEYRLSWPATFNEAYDSFRKLGWFGKMPNLRMQLMQSYEWLASGTMVATGYGCLEAVR
jgi:hypothetical protein